MGFFKKLFNKSIELKEGKLDDNLITRMEFSKPIKFGSSLVVKPGQICVVGAGTLACEVLEPNEYELTGATIPKSFKAGNFCPNVKRGKGKNAKVEMVKYFRPTIYFINVQDFLIDFETETFALNDKLYRKPKVKIKFVVKFYVKDAVKFVNTLAIDWGYLKCDKVLNKIAAWLSDDIVRIVKKHGYSLEELQKEREKTAELLLESIKTSFKGMGMEFRSLEITDVVLPSNVVNEYIENSKTSNEIGEYTAQIDGFTADANFVKVNEDELNMSAPPIEIVSQNEEGNEFKVKSKVCSKCGYETVDNIKYCPMCAHPLDEEDFRTCPVCGVNLSRDAGHCFNCGEVFKKDE